MSDEKSTQQQINEALTACEIRLHRQIVETCDAHYRGVVADVLSRVDTAAANATSRLNSGVSNEAHKQRAELRDDVRELLDDFRTNILDDFRANTLNVFQAGLRDKFEENVRPIVIGVLRSHKGEIKNIAFEVIAEQNRK